MNDITIRPADIKDAADILKIYEYYVKETAISFEYNVPTLDEMKARITKTLRKYPYFAAVHNNQVIGYAYAGAFIGRAAYDYSAELTIYIDKDSHGCGIGRKLYEALEDALKKMGVTNLYACIGYPDAEDEYLNFNSANFHAHMGYTKCGEFYKCGYKFGRWYHMIWMEKIIGRHISK
ncbi:MAG: GNAT family N-acetyltransferase [Clostridium sp.]|nr:GNAT family N-acetyltransferase [Clostridium sp.]